MNSEQPPQKSQRKTSKKKTSSSKQLGNSDDRSLEPFPIVGIGASAGGLEAFIQLLKELPTNTGMAFVIVQHMAADQESLLSVILARATQMPVHEVQDGMIVQPNQVYVIPPNVSMTIAQGALKLEPRYKPSGVFMSVDMFLLSLAEERGNKAFGVVLSGGDSDGSKGIEAIKAAGGVTFAQCQDSAQVDSMPNKAVATGQVDFVLPPGEIAKKIAEISTHAYIVAPVDALSESEASIVPEKAMSTIFGLLRSATGVDFTHYKPTTIKRRIHRRMMLQKLEQVEEYASHLQSNPAEVMALYQDALIHVTSFFRDPDSFEALKSHVFPVIVKDKSPETPIRIWVAGCSTGEEAYSIAICLIEFLANQTPQPSIQIYATDVSETAIDYARNGIYTISQTANVSPERLRQFFVQMEGRYQISKAVRELCVFARQNLISDPPFSKLDLISCRNVLIYLGNSLQKKLLPIFHYGLKPTGFLVLSSSETVGTFSNLFDLIDKKNKIYAKKLAATPVIIDLPASTYLPMPVDPHLPTQEEALRELEMQKDVERIILSQFAPVGVVVNSDLEILQFRGQTSAYLEPAPGKASFNLLKMAKEGLRMELRTIIYQAGQQKMPVKREGLSLMEGDRTRFVNMHVIPFQSTSAGEDHFLVLFEDASEQLALPNAEGSSSTSTRKRSESQEIIRLQQELKTTKEHLQSIIEEQQATNQDLRAANEEILSSNEELQSTNEELETAKEEIQAVNEELNTINEELQRRNTESAYVSNDLQNLLSSINIPILMLGADLQIRRFTPAIEGIFNLISTDVGRPLSDITHRLNIPNLEQQILEVLQTLSIKVQEVQDQEGYWYALQIRPYRTSDNKIEGAVVVLVDIDDLKRSTAQLAQLTEARDYAEAIVQTVREPLLVLDSDLRVVTANSAFYQTFQVAQPQTEECLIFELGNGQWDIPQLRSLLEAVLVEDRQFQNFEVEHEFEQIGQRTMLLNARKILMSGDAQIILLAIEDITHQKRLAIEHDQLLEQEQAARTAAEAANRAKDEFLSLLSHELRSPLNAMIGWTQILRNQHLDAAKTAQALEVIERSAKAQAQLIEEILDVSRITTGRLRLMVQPFEIAPLIATTIEGIRLTAEAKKLQITSRLSPAPEKVYGDPLRLQQVMSNLLSNAIKFTPSGGSITVQLDYLDHQAQIQVSDTGQGISAEFLPYVFDRFRQADGGRSRTNPGLGLGLSIVRHVVELHGGTVQAESPGQGQGATFTIRLPLRPDRKESTTVSFLASEDVVDITDLTDPNETQPPDDVLPSLQGVRVLVVEDEANLQQLYFTMLEQHGAIVTTVVSAQEAFLHLRNNPTGYDVLLSDIGMPGEDGYQFIRRVRSLAAEAGGQIPAAAITAYARAGDRQEAIAAGFQMYLAKPVQTDQLVRVVANLAGRTRRER
ncbi:MAG TPA: chemotaxis protein CheB [Trichocoleus sp.]|jgi:two-component system CheB/CheR fusion protein